MRFATAMNPIIYSVMQNITPLRSPTWRGRGNAGATERTARHLCGQGL